MALRLRLALERLPDGDDAVRQVLTQTVDEIGATAEEVRRLARGIHPAILEEAGLQAALASLVDRSPLDVRTDFALMAEPSAAAGATAYFVVAEALTNAVKHAGDCDVAVVARTVDGRLHVSVTDDGPAGPATARDRGWRGSRIASVRRAARSRW